MDCLKHYKEYNRQKRQEFLCFRYDEHPDYYNDSLYEDEENEDVEEGYHGILGEG